MALAAANLAFAGAALSGLYDGERGHLITAPFTGHSAKRS